MATSYGNETKNTTSYGNEAKSDAPFDAFILEIGDGYDLLIDSTYNLEIQSNVSGTTWGNELKS